MASTTLNAHKSAAQLNADYHKKLKIQSTVIFVICIILAVICLVPIYILIVNATRTSTDITSNGISLIPGLALGDNLKKLTTQAEYKVSFNAFYGFRNRAYKKCIDTISIYSKSDYLPWACSRNFRNKKNI